MMRTSCLFLIITLQILSFCYIPAGRHFASLHDHGNHHIQHQYAKAEFLVHQGNDKMGDVSTSGMEETLGGLSRLGSKPPNCRHKCKGCVPCYAIQTPTNTEGKATMGVFYANYEPEGWKCKCGSAVYDP